MAFSKIILNGVTQIDLTQDTVAAANLISPNTAHGANGQAVVGTASAGLSLAEFEATVASTDASLVLDIGDYTLPNKFIYFLKSDVTEGDGVNVVIRMACYTNETVVTHVNRYHAYKANLAADYYTPSNSGITISGSTLTLKYNNNHKFLSGATYGLQIYELDDTFFT